MTPRFWFKTILFWVLMVSFSIILMRMSVFGNRTKVERILNFAPLAIMIALFLFVLTIDRTMKRKAILDQERRAK